MRRPRVRNVEERFERRVLPLFARKSKKVADLIPELYLHGLAEGDFDLALRGLLGDEARVSASTVARLKEKWHAELAEWRQRPLDDLEVVYMWVDGVYVKAGLEKEKAAILVVLVALSDGSKVVVSAMPGYRESTESWSEVLRGLKERGLECPRLVIGDGHLGIWGALRNVYREAAEQRCWNHKILNVLDKLPKREQAQAKLLLCRIPYSQSRKEAERLRSIFSMQGLPSGGFNARRDPALRQPSLGGPVPEHTTFRGGPARQAGVEGPLYQAPSHRAGVQKYEGVPAAGAPA